MDCKCQFVGSTTMESVESADCKYQFVVFITGDAVDYKRQFVISITGDAVDCKYCIHHNECCR